MIQWPKYQIASDRELELLLLADLDEPALAAVDRGAVGREALVGLRVGEADHVAVGVVGEQDAGLLEALADGGDPEGETALLDAEPG